MLSIGKLGAGQEMYYLEKVAEGAEDYYSGEGEVPGRWTGTGARELELSGEVGADQLTAMLTGRNPADGSALLGRQGVPARGSVPGFDLTFSAPKSVSLSWALGDPEVGGAVMAAHQRSVGATLDYLQREACWTRRGAGGREFVQGDGFLAAAFEHRSSRNEDPQLHTHVLVANAVQGPDGAWTRLYHPALYEHLKTAGYIYESNLRHELSRELGVRWGEVRNGIAEIEGFTEAQLREFSTRRAEILEAAGGPGASPRAREVAALATRGAKQRGREPETMRERWQERGEALGLDREAIRGALGRSRGMGAERRAEAAADPRTVSAWQVDRAVTAAASHFDRREALQAVAGLCRDGAPAAEVERIAAEFLSSDAVVSLGHGPKGERFTTRRIWKLERAALETAEKMGAEGARPAGETVAARALAAHPTLKADQREMVRRLLTDPEGLAVVIGEAGTGKSYATLAAAGGWSEAGIELRCAAPTWRAANVLRAEGLRATSVAAALGELERGEGPLSSRSVLLVDEAGMLDSATLARLIDHAREAEAKLVLIGDPEQLGEIGAGGLFRALTERTEPIRLEEVIRHDSEIDREGARLIREGEGAEALGLYRSSERVVVAPDAGARREAMVADWHESFAAGQDAVMVAKQNSEVQRLNRAARALRREAGELGEKEIELGGERFAAGDLVITRVNDRPADLYNRERWQVAEVDPEARSVLLEGIDREHSVEVGAEYLAKTNPHSGAPALQHAYALTTYSAQGTTVDRAFVAADPSMDKQELYVAASRSRLETMIYATPEVQAEREELAPGDPYRRDPLAHIAKASERDRAQRAAHDEALRSELRALPGAELRHRRAELAGEARAERAGQSRRQNAEEWLGRQEEVLDGAIRRREATEAAPRKARRTELPRARAVEADARQRVEELREELGGMAPVSHEARAELANADFVLAERARLALTAARLSPPAYVLSELGERPRDPQGRRAWDSGVAAIERYRQEHGVTDRDRALGGEPRDGAERAGWAEQRSRLAEQRRTLGLGQERSASLELGDGMEMGKG